MRGQSAKVAGRKCIGEQHRNLLESGKEGNALLMSTSTSIIGRNSWSYQDRRRPQGPPGLGRENEIDRRRESPGLFHSSCIAYLSKVENQDFIALLLASVLVLFNLDC